MVDADRDEQEVYAVEHFQTGERTRPESLDEVEQWITDMCRCAWAKERPALHDDNDSPEGGGAL